MYKKSLRSKINNYYLKTIIVGLSVVFYFLVTSSHQYSLLLGVMFISPFFLLLNAKKLTINDILLLLGFPLLLFQTLINPEHVRYSTILYSFLFLILFLAYKILLKKNSITLVDYLKFIKLIVYSYLVVLVIQQLCVLFSIPVFNLGWAFEDNKWKLNSLSMEPSNTALIVTILLFSYCYCISIVRKRKYNIFKDFKMDKYIWFAYLYICLTTASTSSFFCIPVLAFYVGKKKDVLKAFVFLILFFLILITNFSFDAFQRVVLFIPALLKLDPIALYNIDPSASARLAPPIIYFQQFSLRSFGLWFGYGNDYGEKYLTNYILGYLPDEGQGIGGMINFLYDYGIIVFLYFIILLRKLTLPKFFSYEMLFWFLLIFIIPFNHYIQWLFWCVCATNTYFSLQEKRQVVVTRKSKLLFDFKRAQINKSGNFHSLKKV